MRSVRVDLRELKRESFSAGSRRVGWRDEPEDGDIESLIDFYIVGSRLKCCRSKFGWC